MLKHKTIRNSRQTLGFVVSTMSSAVLRPPVLSMRHSKSGLVTMNSSGIRHSVPCR
jgi:hypothetical protein